MDKAGITYRYIVQKPGDVVYSAYNTYHWVFAPVKCSNIFYLVFRKEEKTWLTTGFFQMLVFTRYVHIYLSFNLLDQGSTTIAKRFSSILLVKTRFGQ